MNEAQMTLAGNLVEDPELRFMPAGQPVAKFRVASTPRYKDNSTGEWKDGDSLFLTCTVWRQAAENVAESLTRGMRVIVTGRLKQRSYETREGEKRTVYELEVDEVGPSLRNASAKVAKVARSAAAAGKPAMAAATATNRRSSRSQHEAPVPAPAGAGAPACQRTSWASTTRTARAIRNLAARPPGRPRERSAERARRVRP
jgi:single-strand DNA-binding protein